jgi:uncharacterized membrane protein YhaH (DUF805 family)
MNWYLRVLKKYAVFSGRARRKEYWYFILFSIIIMIILSIFDVMLGNSSSVFEARRLYDMNRLEDIYALIVLLPTIAVSVRRLHDTNHSGWWLLIVLIPLIGIIVFLIFAVQNSKPGTNKYGVNPKGLST